MSAIIYVCACLCVNSCLRLLKGLQISLDCRHYSAGSTGNGIESRAHRIRIPTMTTLMLHRASSTKRLHGGKGRHDA